MEQIKALQRTTLAKLRPPEKLKVSEWAEKYFVLSAEYGSSPGKFSLLVTPYLREILDCINDPKIEKITWVASAQVAKTTSLLIASAYFIANDPAPILFLEPSDKLAKGIATERFTSVIRDNPVLKRVFDSKDTTDNQVTKIYPGGTLIFGSASSVSDLISRPIRILILDEVDAYTTDLKAKGNPIKMAEDRTITFHNRKIFIVSTPGVEGLSNVMDSYNKSDMRVYKVPCPYCNHYQELEFKQIKKVNNAWKNAEYECINCKEHIKEYQKASMVQAGKWESTNPNPTEEKHAGFKINQLYSLFPNTTWESIGKRLSEAKAKYDINDLKTFTNQVLAETWNDQHLNKIGEHELAERAHFYPSEVPLAVGMLTAGVDFQADRAEITVLGFGKNNQIWLIDHRVIHGETGIDPNAENAYLYKELELYLNKAFKHESGRDIYIRTAFLDVGDGNRTHQERQFCFPRITRKFFAIMGSRVATDIGYSGKHVKDSQSKQPIFYVGTVSLKDEIYNRLRLNIESQPGFIHFPKDLIGTKQPKYSHINDDYYKQLTSEKLIEKRESGIIKRIYVKKTQNARNEALDCFGYALAAFQKEMGRDLSLLDGVCDFMSSPYEPEPDEPAEIILNQPELNKMNNNSDTTDFFKMKAQLTGIR